MNPLSNQREDINLGQHMPDCNGQVFIPPHGGWGVDLNRGLAVFSLILIAASLLLAGCAGNAITPKAGEISAPAWPGANASAAAGIGGNGAGAGANAGGAAGTGAGAGNAAAANASADALQFKEWSAPDGSITLQVPQGWTASERAISNCTVNWGVIDPSGTASAYMMNQLMVLKSEEARQMYKQYGLSGIDQYPISTYLPAEQAVAQVVAPLDGSSNVQIAARNAALSAQFSQAVCTPGLAACDAQVFEATYDYKGTAMRGTYFAQAYDFGEGTTWWINIWGYTSPAAEWDKSKDTLERVFSSVKYTDAWAARCRQGTAQVDTVVGDVIRKRQAAGDRAAQGWDEYILDK